MNDHSQLLSRALVILYPIILIFGIYVILNGHISPGGGFQGGALLMAIYICRYLTDTSEEIYFDVFQRIEKLLLLLVLLVALAFLATMLNVMVPVLNLPYLIMMNTLIGFKVATGMTIIFYKFILSEV